MVPWKHTAAVLGRLSYPLFLLHWPLGGLAIGLGGLHQSLMLLVVAGALSLGASLLVLRFIEDPLVRLRSAIRRPHGSEPALAETMPAISD